MKPAARSKPGMSRLRLQPPHIARWMLFKRSCQRTTLASGARPCSTKNSRPPGRKMRRTSPRARAASGIVHSVKVLSAQSALAGHVLVEDHVNIGWGSGVHQFCRVGAHAMLGAMSKIVQDVPPFIIADGNPAIARSINKVGLERSGFTPERLEAIKHAFRIFYRSGLNRTQAFESMHRHSLASTADFQHFLSFVEKSERGVVAGR